MTSTDVTFFFKKESGSLDMRFLDALQGTTSIIDLVNRDDISYAVSHVFDRLIAKDAAIFEDAVMGLGAFSITFINAEPKRLNLESDDVEIPIKKISEQIAALFIKSIRAPQIPGPKEASSEEKARIKAEKLHQELLQEAPAEAIPKELPRLEPVPVVVTAQPIPQIAQAASDTAPAKELPRLEPFPVVVAAQPILQIAQAASHTPPAKEIAPIASPVPVEVKKSSVWREPTEQEKKFADVFSNMNNRFDTMITRVKRGTNYGQNFGAYLMDRFFCRATSYDYNADTGEFRMIFDEEQRFKLTKLPEGISAEVREGLAKLQNSTFVISKEVKGRFLNNIIYLEPGAITIKWRFSSARLLQLYETQGETITMQIKYGILSPTFASAPAQAFVDFVDCNLSK